MIPGEPGYHVLLVVEPDGALDDVPLPQGASAAAALAGILSSALPCRLRLTSRLDMWAVRDRPWTVPCNLLAAGMARRHGLLPGCLRGTVLLSGTGPEPGGHLTAGLTCDQVHAALTMIADVADEL